MLKFPSPGIITNQYNSRQICAAETREGSRTCKGVVDRYEGGDSGNRKRGGAWQMDVRRALAAAGVAHHRGGVQTALILRGPGGDKHVPGGDKHAGIIRAKSLIVLGGNGEP
ncbi:hypothetical protein JZ751_021075 [Albula glossodonta]|uniref:Uncharacterized protein n=1 Tax=Albula glossodonta TaxID=121402 RepID=A0A8T2PM10_9TELE|nr:hypothetical protein JZ751_021075 [Albula glossodonta]